MDRQMRRLGDRAGGGAAEKIGCCWVNFPICISLLSISLSSALKSSPWVPYRQQSLAHGRQGLCHPAAGF